MPPSSSRHGLVAIPAIERATHAIGLYLSDHAQLDVSQAEAHVLGYLRGRTDARINDIHEEFGHRRSTLTSVLDRLERRNLLKRSIDPTNRRSVVVTLTAPGKTLSRRVFAALAAHESKVLAAFTPAELQTFARVISAFSAPS